MSDPASGVLRFFEFSLDAANAQLRRGSEIIALRPKTFAVLDHLASRAGRLVTKSELLDTVWADATVGEWVLSGCIRELRRAFADDPRAPRVIETAHGHGYRFIAPLGDDRAIDTGNPTPLTPIVRASPTVVGRTDELATLARRLERALRGERQLVLIAGDAGIGKTTLVDTFCTGLAMTSPWIARGQCIQQYGESEPYLPVLDALTRLAGSPAGTPLRAALRRHAPAWLVQVPSLVEPDEAAELQRLLGGTTRERMLREATNLVEVLDRPLVLILEDLHWCDYATLDLLAALARRRDPASLLVIGTYRPAEVIVREHPLKAVVQELAALPDCHQLWLENLEVDAVGRYLDVRCPGLVRGAELARVLYERTDGNPLFMRSVVDALVERGALAAQDGHWVATIPTAEIGVDVPDGLAQMLQRQIDQLPSGDRTVLEAASVVGRTPSAAAVAAALDVDVIAIEDRLDALARQGALVRAAGEIVWPDGTLAGGYELTHALYQSVLRDGVPPARRRRWHQRIAVRLEAAFAERPSEIAAELALHLEEGGEIARAIPHREKTAARAVGRGANREAAAILERTLVLLDALPASPERTLQTIRVSLALGLALQARTGFGDPAVERAYERARSLAAETDDVLQLFQAMAALGGFHLSRAELDRAREDTDRLSALAERLPFPIVSLLANLLGGMVRFHGSPLGEARTFLERAVAIESTDSSPAPMDFRVQAMNYLALVRLHEGRPDTARELLRQSMARGVAVGGPFDRAQCATVGCFVSLLLRDPEFIKDAAATATAIGNEHVFPMATAIGKLAHGRLRAAGGDHETAIAMITEGIAGYRAMHQLLALPTQLGVLAETYSEGGRNAEALATVLEAKQIAETTNDRRYLPELWRLEGALRARLVEPTAEACLRRAVVLAEESESRWLELRARTSLVTWQRGGRRRTSEASADAAALAALAESFTEGASTADVLAARALVDAPRRR